MTHYQQFYSDVMNFSQILRVATVASFLGESIDEFINDCYNNEFDDAEIRNVNDFNDWVNHIYNNFVQ